MPTQRIGGNGADRRHQPERDGQGKIFRFNLIPLETLGRPRIDVLLDVSAVFRSTAEGETGHAHGHLEFLENGSGDPATGLPIGSSRQNLMAAVAGETHEYTDMYPGMARTAREEGFTEVADWFETLAKAEKSHAGRFQKALDTMG